MPTEMEELDQLAEFKRELWSEQELAVATFEAAEPRRRAVAEGDSWFDYPFSKDTLDQLKSRHGYKICKIAEAGDTLENMAYGLGFPARRPLDETLDAIRRYRPTLVLLSAGGNDVVGDAFGGFLNHKASGMASLREDYARFVIFDVARRAYERILERVWSVDPTLHVFAHGYAHALPTGRGALRLFRWSFVGPWLRPALIDKNIDPEDEGRALIARLIDDFNSMLATLDRDLERFHFVNLRPLIREEHWRDELHLTSEGYERVAEELAGRIADEMT